MFLAAATVPRGILAAAGFSAARPRVEVAFVLDSTGSMGGLIEGAKQKIWSIANGIIAQKPTPEVRIGLVTYRDRGDEYVTKKFDLT
ncbi:MAG: VWA domain-containing protein, partial [Spirochaetia bacterium]